jgi:hypothetical protein
MDLSTLEPGHKLFSRRLAITDDAVADYLAAVEDDSNAYAQAGIAPPMAVAALVMGEALQAIELPAGAVHTGQELGFEAGVDIGTEVDCTAKVVQNSVRRGTRFMALEITADAGDTRALTGRVTLAITEDEA